ncbi:MAG: hypothetical protein OHK0041_17760 [Anaerolineales bacterium]
MLYFCNMKPLSLPLLRGDLLTLTLVTALGFLTHDRADAGLMRFLASLLPFALGWLLAAGALNLLHPQQTRQRPALLRILWATLLAAPFAGWLRAFWLQTTVIPIFVLVLFATNALGLILWRAAFWFWLRRRTTTSRV